jgi:hypothetical protein
VIILPVAAEEDKAVLPNAIDRGNKTERLKALSLLSVWDEKDAQAVSESQNFINQWKVVEF